MKKLIAILLVVVFCLCLTSCGNETDKGITQNSSNVENDSVYDTGVALSNNLDDFTFKINDIVYKLPIEIEAFTKNGLKVILLERNNRIASDFDEDFSIHIQKMIDYLNTNDYYYLCQANGLGQALLCELSEID